jgi:hypothetical protein
MRPELPIELEAWARNLAVADPRWAALCALLREAANELETPRETSRSTCPIAPAVPVLDSDGNPNFGRPCPNCWDD